MPRRPKEEHPPEDAAPEEDISAELPDEEELEEELSEIYSSESGTPARSDMTRLEKARGTVAKKMLVGLIVFFGALAAVSWAGFFFFSPTDDKFTGERVDLVIEGPGEVRSGENVEYVVKYRNGEGIALGTSSLEVRLPRSFVLTGTEPVTEGQTWQIGSLAPDASGEVRISGVFLAAVTKELDMQAIVTYRPADFNSEFQRVATRTLLVGDSVIETSVDGPTKVLPGDSVSYTFGYKNVSPNAFGDIAVRVRYPEGFIPESSEPAATDPTLTEWRIADLGAEAEGAITVNGTFASEAQGELTFAAETGFLDDAEEFQSQSSAEAVTDVLQGELVTTLILNGKTSDQPIRFGDVLRYAVTYRNTGTASLGNIVLSVVIETEPGNGVVLWNDLKDEAGGKRQDGTISWDAKNIRSLGRLDEGDEGVVEFEVPVTAEVPDGTEDIVVRSHVVASIESIDGDIVERSTKSQPIAAHLLSDAVLAGHARYFSDGGVPLGTGPLPPKVGETTTFRILWRLSNSLHDLRDLRLSAKLPENVTFTGASSVDAGELRYDATEGKMIWTLNWMPKNVETLNVGFDVALRPSDDQRNTIPTLLDASIFESTDTVASSTLLLSLPPMTAALEEDPVGSGRGRVE